MKLTEKAKRSIHALSKAGLGHRAIAQRIEAELGIKVSHVAIGKFLAREPEPTPKRVSRSPRSLPPSPSSSVPSTLLPSEATSASPLVEEEDEEAERRMLRRLRRGLFRAASRSRSTTLDQCRAAEALLAVLKVLRTSKPTTQPGDNDQQELAAAEAKLVLERLKRLRQASSS